jgi:hypothetical protein
VLYTVTHRVPAVHTRILNTAPVRMLHALLLPRSALSQRKTCECAGAQATQCGGAGERSPQCARLHNPVGYCERTSCGHGHCASHCRSEAPLWYGRNSAALFTQPGKEARGSTQWNSAHALDRISSGRPTSKAAHTNTNTHMHQQTSLRRRLPGVQQGQSA